jgi:hypothetical protein
MRKSGKSRRSVVGGRSTEKKEGNESLTTLEQNFAISSMGGALWSSKGKHSTRKI